MKISGCPCCKARSSAEQQNPASVDADADQGWQGLDDQLQLTGWTKKRRVVILWWPLRQSRAIESRSKQLELNLPELSHSGVLYEYAVLVTSLPDEVRTVAQHYRDRGDSENNFDEWHAANHGADIQIPPFPQR